MAQFTTLSVTSLLYDVFGESSAAGCLFPTRRSRLVALSGDPGRLVALSGDPGRLVALLGDPGRAD